MLLSMDVLTAYCTQILYCTVLDSCSYFSCTSKKDFITKFMHRAGIVA
jgi:hypothetical protein